METRKEIGSAIWRMNNTIYEVSEALEESGGELTPEIEEKLESSKLTKVEVADGIKTLMAKVKTEDAALAEEIKRLQALKKARATALESLKRYLLDYML
ncbi:MAG: siphovirus Gp157 family protein, partial [Firmicutes bacterium]|nr:siphovirus Gp157 family protein [Bacillota bacterium]